MQAGGFHCSMADVSTRRNELIFFPLGAVAVVIGLIVILQGEGRVGSVFFSIGAVFVALGMNARQRRRAPRDRAPRSR
jgi:hypothetical protein